jgi:hypothetical protein
MNKFLEFQRIFFLFLIEKLMEKKMKLETDIDNIEVLKKTLYCSIIVTFSFISDNEEANEEVTIYYDEETSQSEKETRTLTNILAGANTSCAVEDVAEVVIAEAKKIVPISKEDEERIGDEIDDTIQAAIENNNIRMD